MLEGKKNFYTVKRANGKVTSEDIARLPKHLLAGGIRAFASIHAKNAFRAGLIRGSYTHNQIQ